MSELVDYKEAFPSLSDKFAVRLISRLDSSQEVLSEQKRREGLMSEIWDFLTGDGNRRQNQINAHQNDVLDHQLQWLTEMSKHMALGHRAMTDVQISVKGCLRDLSFLGEYIEQLEESLGSLAHQVDARLDRLESHLDEVDLRQRAQTQLDRVMRQWQQGSREGLPPGAALMSILDDLWWGDFGLYVQRFPGAQAELLISDLKHQATVRLAHMTGVAASERIVRQQWFTHPTGVNDNGLVSVVQFLTDWVEVGRAPYTYALNCQADLETQLAAVPQLLSAERLSQAMTKEFFELREAL